MKKREKNSSKIILARMCKYREIKLEFEKAVVVRVVSFQERPLLSTSEIREHLKYFGNVYYVITNHIGDQNTRVNHETTNCIIIVVAYSLVISRLIGFF